ncbi:MAG: hypothetical protein JWM16_153 [Verrucomicrobiales bacterium]|nr:hypothetical protein [Verrucomicrobiales bacterium]
MEPDKRLLIIHALSARSVDLQEILKEARGFADGAWMSGMTGLCTLSQGAEHKKGKEEHHREEKPPSAL